MLHQFPYGVPVPVQPPDFPLEFLKRIGFSGKRRTNAFVKPAFTLKGHVAYAVLLAYSVASVFSLKSERISPIFGIEKDLVRLRQRQPVPSGPLRRHKYAASFFPEINLRRSLRRRNPAVKSIYRYLRKRRGKRLIQRSD